MALIINIEVAILYFVKVGIRVDDYRLSYQIAKELKKRGFEFVMIKDYPECAVDFMISEFEENLDAVGIVRRFISQIYGKQRFGKMVVGIDPGPRPGVVVVGDGNIVEEEQLNNVSDVRKYIDKVFSDYDPERMIIRIGNGDLVNRNRIVNSLVSNYRVEIVDERNTSEKNTNKDIESAKAIAFSKGTVIKTKLNTVVRDGYLRELQRRSRIESNGLITISKKLAREVALGNMSLQEAIEYMREKE